MIKKPISRAPAVASQATSLRRSLTLPLLTLYGLGVTLGAGIYVLIGVTAAEAGPYAWVAFLLAAFVVGFTALSYAELATRYPFSAGESAYVHAGFGRTDLATAVGLLVAASGLISASAITVGASGYLGGLTAAQPSTLIMGIVGIMGLLSWWGITQSVVVAGIVTVIEILGLIVVIVWSMTMTDRLGVPAADMIPPLWGGEWKAIISATVLAFFAFVGFEDMANVAEEVVDPRRNIPKAIFLTLVIATSLYIATCIAVSIAVPIDALAGSTAPLTLVFANAPETLQVGFAALAVVATVNGVLVQMIMVSRVIYGMADRGQLPATFARLSPRTRTPSVATAFVVLCILALSLFLPIGRLAAWTSQIVLSVFLCVNLALVAIQRRGTPQGDHFSTPRLVPILGIVTSGLLLAVSLV